MTMDDGREMVPVPAGPFTMGSDEFARERPVHVVDLPAFWIDRFPVTNEAFAVFVARHRPPGAGRLGRRARRGPAPTTSP